MKTNSIYKTSLLAAALLLSTTSCVKDELHDTPHPDYGKITVTADWTDRGDDVNIPAEWTVTMGDYTGTETGETHAPDYLFNPGDYTLAACNIPENITISGTTATITGTPGWLFTSVQEVTVEADTDYDLTATMRQQVRQLTLVIEPTGDAADRIESIEGALSGAAGTMDFATGTYKITEGDDAGKWTATVRLLGIAGDLQRLTATLTYSNGNPQPTELESDLTAALVDFNSDKTEPLTLGGTIAETPTEAGVEAGLVDFNSDKTEPLTLGGTIAETPTEAGVEAGITGWEKIDGGGVDAEM